MSPSSAQRSSPSRRPYHNGEFVRSPRPTSRASGRCSSIRPTSPLSARRARRPRRHYATLQTLGVEVCGLHRHALHPQGWHDASETIRNVRFPCSAIHRDDCPQLRRDDRGGGAWRCGTFVISPAGQIKVCGSMTSGSAAPPNCCANPGRSTSPVTTAKCARRSGSRVPGRSHLARAGWQDLSAARIHMPLPGAAAGASIAA
jgi:hypothetical protein